MRVRLASGDWGRVVGDLRTVARGTPFRVALGISVLLHVALFVVVRWDPAGFADSRGARMLHLHLIEEASEPVAPIAGAAKEASAAMAPATAPMMAEARADERPDAAGPGAAAETKPDPAVTASVAAFAPSAGAAPGVDPPAAPTFPATPAAPPVADAPAGIDAPARAGVLGSPQEQPARDGSAASSETGPAQAPGAVAHVAAGGGTTPADQAHGAGAVAGDPGGIAEAGAPDVLAVRRRIDARKVYPRVAVRNGWEGRVLVEMRLDSEGGLKAVRVVQGSGHAVLDEATIASVRRASPFPPVAGTLTVPVEYRLIP